LVLAQDAYQIKVASIFQNVDKSQVPTQYLKEFGYSFMPMDYFKGVLADTNVLDMTAWRLLYGSFYSSYVGNTSPSVPALSAVNSIIKNYETSSDAIPISLLYVNYNDLRPDAITSNLLTGSNEQLYDVAGRSAIPFRSQTMFAAAASFVQSYTPVTKFIFNCDLIFSNITSNFSGCGGVNSYSVSVDFADGLGYRNVAMGATMNISWALTGIYKIKVKVTTPTNTIVESWFQFRVNNVPCTNCYAVNTASIFNTGNSNFSPSATQSGGTISYILSKNNPSNVSGGAHFILKPLIVAEGFDAHYVAPHYKDKNYDINDFIREMQASGQLDNLKQSLSDKLDLDAIASYDLIFIDYNNGTDDIKRNEILFQNVVYEVNKQKAQARNAGYTTYDNVVFGSSMGGLVTRYGLADIVRNGFRLEPTNHNPETRILVTHDSPHHGANIPLALQYLIRRARTTRFLFGLLKMTDLLPVVAEANNLLDSRGPEQMLIYFAGDEFEAGVSKNNFLKAGGEYRTMVDNIPFTQNGISTPYQMIALSNGSQCGTSLFQPGSSILDINAGALTWTVPIQLGLETNIQAHASNMQSSNEVAFWNLFARIHIFLIAFSIDISIDLIDYHANSPSFVVSYDGAAGGVTSLPSLASTSSVGSYIGGFGGFLVDILLVNGVNVSQPQTLFSFIPTGSALDADNFIDNPEAINQNYSNNFNANYQPHFSNFIAQNQISSYLKADGTTVTGNFYNTPHISFQPKNSIWLYENLTNSVSSGQECSTECGIPSINGPTNPTALCTNQNLVLSFNSGGLPVTWTASDQSAVNFTTSSNGNVSVTRNGNYNGIITITASFVSGVCIITSSSYSLEVGTAITNNFTITGPFSPCKGSTAEYHISPYQSDANYSWICTGFNNCGNIYPGGTANNYADFVLPNNPTQNYFTFTVTTTRTTSCGTNSVVSQSNYHQFGSSCSSFLKVGVSPNPASNTLNLNVVDESPTDSKTKIDPEFQVTIADLVGNVKYNNKHSTVNTEINLSNFKNGNYSIRVIKGTEVVTKSFSVVK